MARIFPYPVRNKNLRIHTLIEKIIRSRKIDISAEKSRFCWLKNINKLFLSLTFTLQKALEMAYFDSVLSAPVISARVKGTFKKSLEIF